MFFSGKNQKLGKRLHYNIMCVAALQLGAIVMPATVAAADGAARDVQPDSAMQAAVDRFA